MNDDHSTIWAYESAACNPTAGEAWLTAVEKAAQKTTPGLNIDGDNTIEGYSIDQLSDMFDKGATVAEGVAFVLASRNPRIDTPRG